MIDPCVEADEFIRLITLRFQKSIDVTAEEYYEIKRALSKAVCTEPCKEWALDYQGRRSFGDRGQFAGPDLYLTILGIKPKDNEYGIFDPSHVQKIEAIQLLTSIANSHLHWRNRDFPWPGERFQFFTLIERWLKDFDDVYGESVVAANNRHCYSQTLSPESFQHLFNNFRDNIWADE